MPLPAERRFSRRRPADKIDFSLPILRPASRPSGGTETFLCIFSREGMPAASIVAVRGAGLLLFHGEGRLTRSQPKRNIAAGGR